MGLQFMFLQALDRAIVQMPRGVLIRSASIGSRNFFRFQYFEADRRYRKYSMDEADKY